MNIKIWMIFGMFESGGERPAIAVFLDEDLAKKRKDEWDAHEDCLETQIIEFEQMNEDDKELKGKL